MDDDVLADRWAFLGPWCAPMRSRRLWSDQAVRTRVPVTCSGLQVRSSSEEPPADLRGVRDAMLLLALLEHVDHREWVHVLSAHCGLSVERWGGRFDPDERAQTPFVLTLNAHRQRHVDRIPSMLLELFSGLDAPLSTNLEAAARQIIACGGGAA